jgi:hypothetical protein
MHGHQSCSISNNTSTGAVVSYINNNKGNITDGNITALYKFLEFYPLPSELVDHEFKNVKQFFEITTKADKFETLLKLILQLTTAKNDQLSNIKMVIFADSKNLHELLEFLFENLQEHIEEKKCPPFFGVSSEANQEAANDVLAFLRLNEERILLISDDLFKDQKLGECKSNS